jgi:hypothetical protein
MEVTQRLKPVQDKAYQLFTEVEGRGADYLIRIYVGTQ